MPRAALQLTGVILNSLNNFNYRNIIAIVNRCKKPPDFHYEAIIVGGSYTGLSAAMTLGRSLRQTLVIDGGHPCNATTPQSHNFITLDGRPPVVIPDDARHQVLAYPAITIISDQVTVLDGEDLNFRLITQSGKSFAATYS